VKAVAGVVATWVSSIGKKYDLGCRSS
jgi:hypothetical protein